MLVCALQQGLNRVQERYVDIFTIRQKSHYKINSTIQ